jgi:hypothetical protein
MTTYFDPNPPWLFPFEDLLYLTGNKHLNTLTQPISRTKYMAAKVGWARILGKAAVARLHHCFLYLMPIGGAESARE